MYFRLFCAVFCGQFPIPSVLRQKVLTGGPRGLTLDSKSNCSLLPVNAAAHSRNP